MKKTEYTLYFTNLPREVKLAVAADLHGDPHDRVLHIIKEERPDMILIPGDLMDDTGLQNAHASGYTFLKECASIAPTFYSLGNHEIACYHKGKLWSHPIPRPLDNDTVQRIRQSGVFFLDNEYIEHEGFTVCGLTSGLNGKKNEPDSHAIHRFETADGFRILLCHHPEYFYPTIEGTSIELTVSGHAHGGQWRFFGRGIYAPGQGVFPKYTSGVRDGRFVISRGLSNHTHIPRINNPTEIVFLHLKKL